MDRRTLLKAGLIAPAALAPVVLTEESASASPHVAQTLATGLDTPWGIAFLPFGDALVTERDSGWVTRVSKHGGKHRIRKLTTHHEGESGLMGIALHPRFAESDAFRWVYVYKTTSSDNRVVRMKYVDEVLGDEQPILTGLPMNTFHNGGGLLFDDTHLFVSVGDTGQRGGPQTTTSFGGHILRCNLDGTAAAGNPWGNYGWSMGHRNPEGLAFAPNGALWASELGQDTWDELNRIVAGKNYGWPKVEGKDGPGGFFDPTVQFHPAVCSPTGLAIHRGQAWLGALRGQCLWSVAIGGHDHGRKTRYFHGRFGRIRAVEAAPDGSMWISTSNRDGRGSPASQDDRIIRLTFS